MIGHLYYADTASPSQPSLAAKNSVHGAVRIDQKVIEHHLRRIYERENPAGRWIESGMYQAVRDILESAVDEGTSSQRAVHGSQPSSPSQPDLAAALKRSADVFAAHKVHRIQQDMARLLVDDQGNLRSFSEWRELVTPIAAHQVGPWLETEYSTAVLRAQQAVEWQQFEAEADVLPNLRWVPSTAVHPGADHQVFWNTILPIHHPFWDQHRPGDRWNCHCSLEATDEHPTAPPRGYELRGNGPQPGLNENPGKTGRLFAQSHPYFPQSCAQCAFYQGKLGDGSSFRNAEGKCEYCQYIHASIEKTESVSFEPFSPMVVEKLNEQKHLRDKISLFNEILNDNRAQELSRVGEARTVVFPGHKGSKHDTWKGIKKMAEDLNQKGESVIFLPELEGKTSADALVMFKGRPAVADFKYCVTTNANTLAGDLEKGFSQAGTIVVKLVKMDAGVFCEAIDYIVRNEIPYGNIKVLNKYGDFVEITKKDVEYGSYKKRIKGFLK